MFIELVEMQFGVIYIRFIKNFGEKFALNLSDFMTKSNLFEVIIS